MRFPFFVVIGTAILVSGCADVTTDPTVPAFSSASSAGATAFEAARDAESTAFNQAALNAVAKGGRITTDNCWNARFDASKCQASVTANGQTTVLQSVADNGAKLTAALAAYGQSLQQLATAKDITDRQTAIGKLASSIGQIGTLAGFAGAQQVGALVATLEKYAELNDRRLQVLAVAQQADNSVGAAADTLQSEAELLQQSVVVHASDTVAHEEATLAIAPAGQKAAAAQDLIAAVAIERKAGALKVSIAKPLKEAHAAMIKSLQNPELDPSAGLAAIAELAKEYTDIQTAFGGAPAATSTKKGS